MTLNNFAGLLRAQGRQAEAEPMYRRALTIFEQALEPTHLKIATCRMNYARLLREMDRQAAARALEAQVGRAPRLTADRRSTTSRR
jgi:hypothetical protein